MHEWTLRGVSFAIIQNPLSRFGDTAANTGILVALGELAPNMPIATQTAFASLGGATWRIALTPVDTFKTTLQVQGSAALDILKARLVAHVHIPYYHTSFTPNTGYKAGRKATAAFTRCVSSISH